MGRSLLLRIGAGLTLITCLGHVVGTFMPVPSEQVGMLATLAAMKATLVPMPVGPARSYLQILDGNNLCTALFLLLCGGQFLAVSGSPGGPAVDRVLLLTALGLGGFALLSGLYFFPVPTVFTGVAAVLGLVARSRR